MDEPDNEDFELAEVNDLLIMIAGESSAGKSASLMGLSEMSDNPQGWKYMNCEAGKKLPFRKAKFTEIRITDPYQVHQGFNAYQNRDDCEGIIIDTATFLMEMFETVHVNTATNTMKAWGLYNQFFKILMQQKVAVFPKPVIMLAHTKTVIDDEGVSRTSIPVKGALANNGIEAFFSLIVYAKKVPIRILQNYSNPLLNITAEDEALGYKHVFQTRLTKNTVGDRIRAPIGMWPENYTYIDNNAHNLVEHVREYYSE